jgi:hypothetical protein
MTETGESNKLVRYAVCSFFSAVRTIPFSSRLLNLTVGEYRTVLMVLKKRNDCELPSTINELSPCYDNWKDSIRPSPFERKKSENLSF